MITPSPFDRLLQEAMQLASKDPAAAHVRLDDLHGKSQSAADVLKLGAFAVHLGLAVLGRVSETIAFQRKLLLHPSAESHEATRRSLLRGLAVALRFAGAHEDADAALTQGVTTDVEKARYLVLAAQTFAARSRLGEAAKHLSDAVPLLSTLERSDELASQAHAIAANLARAAETHLRHAGDLLHAATRALVAGTTSHDWRARHQALYHRGRTHLQTGDPARALSVVQDLMALEDANDASPIERFFTANLACRAQIARGMTKVAGAALEACRDFAKRCGDDRGVITALADLEATATGRTTI